MASPAVAASFLCKLVHKSQDGSCSHWLNYEQGGAVQKERSSLSRGEISAAQNPSPDLRRRHARSPRGPSGPRLRAACRKPRRAPGLPRCAAGRLGREGPEPDSKSVHDNVPKMLFLSFFTLSCISSPPLGVPHTCPWAGVCRKMAVVLPSHGETGHTCSKHFSVPESLHQARAQSLNHLVATGQAELPCEAHLPPWGAPLKNRP